ncbi:MAG: ATP-binding protein, partial [Geothrix sp.]|nr:ATP-binding protein [Geothrix sp.]
MGTRGDATRRRIEPRAAGSDPLDLLEHCVELAKVGGKRLQVATLRQSWTRQTFQILDLEPGDAPTLEEDLAYYTPEARPVIRGAIQTCIETGAPFDLELSAVTAKGRPIQVRTQGFAVVKGGRTLEVIRVFQDITDRHQREAQERLLEAQLHQVQKMESLGLLAGGIAHDINNALASILAVATVQRRKAEEGSPLHHDMQIITQACLRGGSLVKALQGFARVEVRERQRLNLNDLIREVVRDLEATVPEGITVETDLSDGLGDLDGEPAALSQAIRNLCVNAFEAMPEGGTLRIRTGNDGPDGVFLEVEDSGAGMAPEVLHQAMLPFYTTKHWSGNRGLGLSLVHQTVESHR